jgi:vacuolar-type H+-ATPase subunit H
MRSDEAGTSEVEDAIATVLRAERDAEEAVERCRADCAAEVARAREGAAGIAARTERRITALNTRISSTIDRRVRELEALSESDVRNGEGDAADLDRAAAALVRELTGAAR